MRYFRLLLLSLLIMPAVACKPSLVVPKELVGSWVTQDPRYQGKILMIDGEGFIMLVVDAETLPKAERIDSMTSTTQAGVATYVLETSDQAGAHERVTVMYRAVNGGELRLAHPNQVVWQRAAPIQ
jgi:hypothetical protein